MSDKLDTWLLQNAPSLCEKTLHSAPNTLPEPEEVEEFIGHVARACTRPLAEQLQAVQAWALAAIGADTDIANDWVLILRLLKENTMRDLGQAFGAEYVLANWSDVDRIFTYALVEATKLASGVDHALLLDHMVSLRRQMEELDRSKSNFIQVAAHELKTPLTLLEGYTDMLREAIPEDNLLLQMYLAGLDGGTYRLREIIGDMVDLSMIESGIIKLSYQMIYLHRLVPQVAHKVHTAFVNENRRVDLVIEKFETEEMTYGDSDRLAQVFSKVISNGLKYTPDGGRVTIDARLVRQDEATEEIAGYVDVRIKDTGIGIDPQNLERIFQSFGSMADVSLHSSGKTKFKGGGPGLGLPIARGIVEAHGGRIWAESEGFDERARHGSTFHIELPLWRQIPTNSGS